MKDKLEKFLAKAQQVHGDRYDYSKTVVTKITDDVVINCPKHGKFKQKASGHLSGNGCPKCSYERRIVRNGRTLEQFLAKAQQVHGDRYDYSKVVYKNSHTKILIICPHHGEFQQSPSNHLRGYGCSACGKESRGG